MATVPLSRAHAAEMRRTPPHAFSKVRAEAEAARIFSVLEQDWFTHRAICQTVRFMQVRVRKGTATLLDAGLIEETYSDEHPGLPFYRQAGATNETPRWRLTEVDLIDIGKNEVIWGLERPKSVVYFVQRPDGLVKIGYTSHLSRRLREINLGAAPTHVLLTIPGGREAETILHRRFGQFRVTGEWFRKTHAMDNFIRAAHRRRIEGRVLANRKSVD